MSGSFSLVAIAVATAVVVGIALQALQGSGGESRSGPAASHRAAVARSTSGAEAASVSSTPANAADAKEVAGEFALALFGDDLDRMARLATPEYAERLTEPAASGEHADKRPAGRVRVVAVQTEGFLGDAGLLQVLVERDALAVTGRTGKQVQLVNVVVLRVQGRWRVDDAAF